MDPTMVWKRERICRRDQVGMMLMIMVMVIGVARSDTEKDREECGDKLGGLLSCVPYVGGEADSPTIDCCTGLKGVLQNQNSKKCLCILIKDRDDPNLGFHINASLALHLPSACHAPHANISNCVDLLHLAPNSPEARIFQTSTTKTNTSSSTPTPAGSAEKRSSGPPSAAAKETSNGAVSRLLVVAEAGILSFVLIISHFFILV